MMPSLSRTGGCRSPRLRLASTRAKTEGLTSGSAYELRVCCVVRRRRASNRVRPPCVWPAVGVRRTPSLSSPAKARSRVNGNGEAWISAVPGRRARRACTARVDRSNSGLDGNALKEDDRRFRQPRVARRSRVRVPQRC